MHISKNDPWRSSWDFCETMHFKSTFAHAIKLDEKTNSLLVEIQWDYDVDKFRMMCLSQEPSNYNTITVNNLSKVGKHQACNSSTSTNALERNRKMAKVNGKLELMKVKLKLMLKG